MPYPVHKAIDLIEGPTPPYDDLRHAARVIAADRTRLLRVELWARRLVEAADPDTEARAHRQLLDALAG